MNITLHLTGPLGTSITVNLANESEVLPTLRRFGKQGWTSGEIPAGGLVLPLAMADTFDWSLIGARPYLNNEGEQCVMYRGQSYKRRDLDEVDTKKIRLPRITKFSRGARPTDPAHLKEGDESGVQYVTLLRFAGGGRVIEAYLDQQDRTPQAQQQAQSAARPAQAETPNVLRKELLARMQAACTRLKTSTKSVIQQNGKHQLVEFDDLDLARIVVNLEAQVAL